ncbi:MAG: MFS transporter [Clostridiales bacterium]|nr:MFS transporter [Clostridiales bacterium]
MKELMKKLGFGEKLSRNFLAIVIIAAGGTIIYYLPYFRYDYYDAYLSVYNLTNTQMGVFGSIYGVFGMISYFFGGYLADKVSVRNILTISLLGTGLGGFLHLLPLSFGWLCGLYAFWGFTSLFAFWPACVKATRIMSDQEDQGKAFGWFEGWRGVVSAIVAPLAVLAYSMGVKKLGDDVNGMRYVIIFLSVLTCLIGIFVFFTTKNSIVADEQKVSFKNLGEVLKLPAVWMVGMVTFCIYCFTMSIYYFVPYATSFLGMTVTVGALLAAFRRWLAPLSAFIGGHFVDKFGTSKVFLLGFIIPAIGTVVCLLFPHQASSIIPYIIVYLVIYIFFNINYSLSWSMMEEGKIPEHLSGTAAGVISTIGYLPEIFCSLLAGRLIDQSEGPTGYYYYFGFLVVMMIVGMVFVRLWKRYLDKINVAEPDAIAEIDA